MKTPIEREYRVTYDKRGWGDETIWTRESVEFTEHDAARDYFLWIKDKPWVRYPDVEARPAPQPWLHHAQPETPPVELPTEPTAGWIDTNDGRHRYDGGAWWPARTYTCSATGPRRLYKGILGSDLDDSYVTAFTPAVAVPKAALDELRRQARSMMTTSPTHVFLAAVDEANR